MNVSLEQQQQFQHDLERLTDCVNRLSERMVVLETLDERHALLCPYQVDIRRASNNLARIGKLEDGLDTYRKETTDKLHKVDLYLARISALSGAGGVLVGGLLIPFIQKMLGL